MSRSTVKICLQLDVETAELLGVLASSAAINSGDEALKAVNGRAIAVLEHLAYSAADGVRRPGSWERVWLEQAFGSWDEQLLETDPKAPWRRRPATDGAL